MQREEKINKLLSRVDELVRELTEIKLEISELRFGDETSLRAEEILAESEDIEEYAAESFLSSDLQDESAPANSPTTKDVYFGDDSDIIFVPKKQMTLEESFEPHLSFYPRKNLTLADTFLYANELCWGDRAEFESMLDDIEKMSSQSQLENYLFSVYKLDRDSESVKQFLEYVKSTSSY